MKKLIALILCLVMVFSLVACAAKEAPAAETETKTEETKTEETKTEEKVEEAPADAEVDTAGPGGTGSFYADPNYEVIDEAGYTNLNDYYAFYGVECDNEITSGGPVLYWHGGENVPLPTPAKQYKIAYSAYCTFDEVGAMYYSGMQDACAEVGIELLINDADYDQNIQNQCIEQWILEGVDAIIMTACDFYGCKDALDSLVEADIPVITLDCPPCAGSITCSVMYDSDEQGRMAAEALIDLLESEGTDSGTIYYGTLPFVHPNAILREYGFIHAFDNYPGFDIKALTGEEAEEHYTAFEGILQADDSIVGLWGLYSSATWGIMQAAKAYGKDIPITSVDNDRVILEGIYNGDVIGSCCYGAVEGSRLALAATILYLNGEKIPSVIYQGNTFVDKSNVEAAFEAYYAGKTLADYMAGNA